MSFDSLYYHGEALKHPNDCKTPDAQDWKFNSVKSSSGRVVIASGEDVSHIYHEELHHAA